MPGGAVCLLDFERHFAELGWMGCFWQRAFAPEYLSNWALVLVGIGAIGAAWWTLATIRRQTAATETAANAAKLNAQAVIDAERAWILLEGHNADRHNFHRDGIDIFLTFHNYGKTPAQIVEVSLRFVKVSDEEYKLPLQYAAPVSYSYGVPIPPAKPFPTIKRPLELSEQLVLKPDIAGHLIFYGFIRYRDVFYDSLKALRETYVRMRFEQTPSDLVLNLPGQWVYDGPPEANRCT
jgi:hypothetical protein